jgi:mRNA-degrading endonuclease RelE of RelBE toxin-antitoxin system
MYEIELSKISVKAIESFDAKTQERIYKAMQTIKTNPFWHDKIKKLKGALKGRFRYRIDEIRIIYKILEESKTVFIEAIGKRGSVYK